MTAATATRKARTTSTTRTARNSRVVGANGARVIAVGNVDAEIIATDTYQGETRVVSIQFPVPDTGDWAIVQISQADGSRWSVGYGHQGWQHDEFPGLHEAVEAINNPRSRAQILNRTTAMQAVYELDRQARAAREAAAALAVPASACPAL